MKKARVYNYGLQAGELHEIVAKKEYKFIYSNEYNSHPISLTMPVDKREFIFESFPPFFEGLLPEGMMLENLLRTVKLDADDYFAQLVYVGSDLVGSVTIEEFE